MRLSLAASVIALAVLAVACGGGGGGGTTPAVVPTSGASTAAPSASPTTLPASSTVSVSAGQSATFAQISNGYAGTITIPQASSGAGSGMTATLQSTLPSTIPAVQSIARTPRSIGVTLIPLVYVALAPSGTMTFASSLSFTFVLPNGTSLAPGSSAYVGFYDPAQGQWQTLLGPGTVNGQTISFGATTGSVTLTAGTTYAFVLFSTAQPIVAATASPTTAPTTAPTTVATSVPTTVPTTAPTASPTPTPSPTPITFNENVVYVGNVDASCTSSTYVNCGVPLVQTVTASQSNGFVGPFTATSSNSSIFTAVTPGSNGQTSIDVHGHAAGTGTLMVTGYGGATASVPVYVTTLSIAFNLNPIAGATAFGYALSGTWGSSAPFYPSFSYPTVASTYSLLNTISMGLAFGNGGMVTPLLTTSVQVLVSNGTINLVNKTVPINVIIGQANSATVSVP